MLHLLDIVEWTGGFKQNIFNMLSCYALTLSQMKETLYCKDSLFYDLYVSKVPYGPEV